MWLFECIVVSRLAIEEMLAYKDVYGWSEEFVAKLEERTM